MRQVVGGQSPSLTVLSHEPRVAVTPLSLLDGQVVPTNLFSIRNHFPVPLTHPEQSLLTRTVKGGSHFSAPAATSPESGGCLIRAASGFFAWTRI